MKMIRKCLYCYEELTRNDSKDYHEKCSITFFNLSDAPTLPYSLHEMSELAKNVIERSISVPGVQPKLSLTLINETIQNVKNARLTIVGALGGNYIFKPPSSFYPEMPENEHLTMRIAETFGIKTVPSSLIRLQSNELAYITKRIDRTEDGNKIHMLDMFQILDAVDKYKSSMEKIGKALDSYSSNTLLDKLNFFELTLFCFITGNNDMHLKNFSMICSNKNKWTLAPAYDLLNVTIVNPDDTEELGLTLEGKKKKLNRENFESLGLKLGLNKKQIEGVFKKLKNNKAIAIKWIKKSFLSIELQEKYIDVLEKRYRILNLS